MKKKKKKKKKDFSFSGGLPLVQALICTQLRKSLHFMVPVFIVSGKKGVFSNLNGEQRT